MSGDKWRPREGLRRAGRLVFRDRVGFTLFLGALAFVLLFWRTGILINDNITLRETLKAIARGRVWIEPATGKFLQSPGTGVRDGLVYGRNYGQLVISLPALWGLRLLESVASLRVALTAIWHLVALSFVVQLGRILSYESTAAYLGSGLVVTSFLGNLALTTTLSDPSLAVLALQLTAALTAAMAAVLCYRFLAWRQSRSAGVLAGTGLILATPVAFWGLVPKRHVFSVALVVGVVFAFARSREPDATTALPFVGPLPAYRAAAYALVGVLTWINAEEGLYVFLALVTVDLPTAPSNDRHSLAAVAGVFGLSLIPFLSTNLLVTGHPLRPPRSLFGGYLGGTRIIADSVDGTAIADSVNGTKGATGGLAGIITAVIERLPSALTWVIGNVIGSLAQGLRGVVVPEEMYHTFLRSDPTSIDEDLGFRGVNLAMLESAPVLAGVAAAGFAGTVRSLRGGTLQLDATDLFVLVLIVAYTLTKASQLPLRVTVTVRYLLPLFALGLILLLQSDIARWIKTHRQVAYWTYAGGVSIGGQILFIIILIRQFTIGDAFRLHALIGAGMGGLVALWCLLGARSDRAKRIAVGVIGLAAAATTVFTLLASLYYFSFAGEHILPIVDRIISRLSN